MRLVVAALFWLASTYALADDWIATEVFEGQSLLDQLPEPPIVRCMQAYEHLPEHRCKDMTAGALPLDRTPFYGRAADLFPWHKRNTIWAEDSASGDRAKKLIDGEVATLEGLPHTAFFYAAPSNTYPHSALGDDIEASALFYYDASQPTLVSDLLRLDERTVFEDRTPRLIDLDGFGKTHIVTILTEVTQGASVAVFGIEDDALTLLAQTPYIGLPNRWLNIAGIADFDGSGSSSIALVETPHIGGTLQFWRWETGEKGKPKLTLTAEAPGFSNHEFGSREQRLSAVEDFDNDGVSDIAVPSADRKSLKLLRLSGRTEPQIEIIAEVSLPAAIDKAIGVTRQGDDVVLTVGLEDGSVWAVHQ